MNGEPLPAEHGFPVRMVVPGLYGYVSATKWVTELEVTRFDKATAYWTDSRVVGARTDQAAVAHRRAAPAAGPEGRRDGHRRRRLAADVGVSGVEVQIDEGAWQPATLATAISDDTWVQWSMPWTATEGDHLIRCRATSKTGELQTEEVSRTDPDGATGWHERFITVFA